MSVIRIVRWALFSFLVGVAGAAVIPFGFSENYILALAAGLGIFFAWKSEGVRIAAMCLCMFAFGMMRASASEPEQYFQPPRAPFPFSGTVRSESVYRDTGQLATLDTGGLMRVRLPLFPVLMPGDHVAGVCTDILPVWRSPQSGRVFPPLCVKSEEVIVSSPRMTAGRIFSTIRTHFQSAIESGMSSPASDFLGGLLLGAQQSFSESLKTDFRRAGVSHIVAVSGYNISIIIAGLWCLLRRTPLGKRRSFWLLLTGVALFVGVTGATASVVRAAIMGGLGLLGQYLGRPSASGHALLIAATAMVALDPSLLLSSVGFQLSVLATAGLIYLSPLISGVTEFFPTLWGMKDIGVQTIAATLATAPLIAGVFHTVSLVAIPANLIVVPLIPLAMAVGFAWSVAALMLSGLEAVTHWPVVWMSDVAALAPTALLNGIIGIASFFAHIPFAQVSFEISPALLWAGIALWYVILASIVFTARRRLRFVGQGSRLVT